MHHIFTFSFVSRFMYEAQRWRLLNSIHALNIFPMANICIVTPLDSIYINDTRVYINDTRVGICIIRHYILYFLLEVFVSVSVGKFARGHGSN